MINKRLLAALRNGFTLIEILVSLAVLVIISAFLFSIVTNVNNTWQQGQSQIGPRQSGRAILDAIQNDLETAALPADKSDHASLQLIANIDSTGASLNSQYLYPHAFFWQAPIATDTTYGRNAEVGYFVRWDSSNPANPRAMLCRFFVNPESPASPTNYLVETGTPWLTSSIIEAVAPGLKNTSDPSLSYKGWFTDNVIGLWIRPLDPTGSPILNKASGATTTALGTAYNATAPSYSFDSRQGYSYKVGSTVYLKSGFKDPSNTYQIANTLPPFVEIAIVLLDSRAASRVTQIPTYTQTAPTATSFWTDINNFVASLPPGVRQGARVYSTRIALRNAQ